MNTRLLYAFLIGVGFSASSMPLLSAQASVAATSVQSTICGLLAGIASIIGILAIFLFVLGAVLYGVAYLLPAAGNLKGSAQGWGMGMIIGGVIAIILYILSAFIIYKIASFSTGALIPAISTVGCSGAGSVTSTSTSTTTSGGSISTNPTITVANSGTSGGSKPSGSSPTSATTTTNIGSIGSSTAGGNTYTGAYCQASHPNVSIDNGNFGTGTYSGWTVTGSGFGNAPTDINIANENNDYYRTYWSNYNGEFFATTFRNSSAFVPGNLTSYQFMVSEPFLNFKIVSSQSSGLYTEVLLNNTPFIISYYNTTNGQGNYPLGTFANASINLSPLFCQNVTVRIVSRVLENSTNRNRFIAVGDFYLSNSSIATPGILVNSTVV